MDEITRALMTEDLESLPVSTWQKTSLAPYVFRHTSATYRKGLLPNYAQALYRWKRQEDELLPLLRAWNHAGIVPLLIKGVAMAIKHYGEPCERYFGDMDVVVEDRDTLQARDIAAGLGWLVLFDARRDRNFSMHESLGLVSPGRNVKLDVHHSILKHPAGHARRAKEIAEKLKPHLEIFHWKDTEVRLLGLTDQAIVPLMLHRAWYRDRWNLKRFDYLDLLHLKHAGLSREMLLERAQELGCLQTVELFLQRCDPWKGMLSLTPLTPEVLQKHDQNVTPERGFSQAQAIGARRSRMLAQAPGMVQDVMRGLGWTLSAALVLQHQQGLDRLCKRVPLRQVATPPLAELWKARIGILGASKLLSWFPRGGSGMCVLRALSMLWWLRSQGVDAELVSGVRNEGGRIKGHAWIEYQGSVVPFIAEDNLSTLMYRVNYRSKGLKNPPQTPGEAAAPGPSATG